MSFSAYSYLTKGASGNSVRELQNDLLRLGFKLPRYGADGSYGGETVQAVRNFQATYGLPVTGTVDQATANAIKNQLAGDIAWLAPIQAPPVIPYSPTTITYPSTPPTTEEAPQWVKDWVGAEYTPEDEEVTPTQWVQQWVEQYRPSVGGVKIDWKWIGIGFISILFILQLTPTKGKRK